MLTAKQKKAVSALLRCPTVKKAAAEAKIGYSTIRRWLQEDEFRNEYEKQLAGLISEAAATAKKGLDPALLVLWEIIADEYEATTTRISAARVFMDSGMKLAELADIASRIEALETQLSEEKNARIY